MGKLFKKISLFFLLALLVSCQFKVPKDPQTLIVPLEDNPNTLNPITMTNTTEHAVIRYVNDFLLDLNLDTDQPVPLLAYKWEVSRNKLRYTLYLREDVKWHDGEQFTADDVIYSFERIKDPKVDCGPLKVDYIPVKKVIKLGKFKIQFVYSEPDFRAILFVARIPIVPKHIFDDGTDFNKHEAARRPIGTGPYKFVEWKTGRHIVLARNENYWRKKPAIKKILFKNISDSTASLQLLKKGEVDMMGLRPIQWVKQINTEKFAERFNKHRYFLDVYYYIGWNNNSIYFKDKRVRRAMTHLINRQEVKQKLMFDQAIVLTGPFGYQSEGYDRSVLPFEFDIEKAKKLLDEAGWIDTDGDGIRDNGGKPFKFTFVTAGGSGTFFQLFTMMRENMLKVGIEMTIQQMEGAAYLSKINERNFDAMASGWSSNPNADPYQIWHSSQIEGGSNHVAFKNSEVDRLLVEARKEFNALKRKQMNQRAFRIIHDEQPYTFLFTPASLVAVDKRFKNVRVYKRGLRSIEWEL